MTAMFIREMLDSAIRCDTNLKIEHLLQWFFDSKKVGFTAYQSSNGWLFEIYRTYPVKTLLGKVGIERYVMDEDELIAGLMDNLKRNYKPLPYQRFPHADKEEYNPRRLEGRKLNRHAGSLMRVPKNNRRK